MKDATKKIVATTTFNLNRWQRTALEVALRKAIEQGHIPWETGGSDLALILSDAKSITVKLED